MILFKSKSEIRRQPSTAQRALSGIAAALGGGGSNSPTHAGLPRIPGIPLLPGGIPRNSQGQIDVVQLIGEFWETLPYLTHPLRRDHPSCVQRHHAR